jgi:hypothetical protein
VKRSLLKEFAGGSLRITEHYAKCNFVPVKLKEWAVDKLGRSAAKHQGKESVNPFAPTHFWGGYLVVVGVCVGV